MAEPTEDAIPFNRVHYTTRILFDSLYEMLMLPIERWKVSSHQSELTDKFLLMG